MKSFFTKVKSGFSRAGVIAGIVAAAAVAVTAALVINATNGGFDGYTLHDGDSNSGYIADHIKGYTDSPVLVFEFADFQCPGCAGMNPYINSAVAEMENDLTIVYRNYLLPYHQNATAAASAAEAAGLQGYWHAMADLLFYHQSDWEYATASERTELFQQYFEEASNGEGDVAKFLSDLGSSNVSKKISFDQRLGKNMGVESTPAFFVDGQRINWSDKSGSSIEINGETISWDHNLNASEFVQLLRDIVKAKTGHVYEAPTE